MTPNHPLPSFLIPDFFFPKGVNVIPGKADTKLNTNEAVCEHTDRRTICLHRLRVVQNVSECGSTGAPLSCVSQSFVRNPVACLLFIVARAVRGQLGDSHLCCPFAQKPKPKKNYSRSPSAICRLPVALLAIILRERRRHDLEITEQSQHAAFKFTTAQLVRCCSSLLPFAFGNAS